MKKNIYLKLTVSLFILMGFSYPVLADVYYETNYDLGITPKFAPDIEADSIWTLPSSFATVYGDNNHFKITNAAAHSGEFSLQFVYQARNGFCNTCGSVSDIHISSGHDGVDYFISESAADLTISDNPDTTKLDDGIKSEPGKFAYNNTNGFSKWEIVSVTNANATNDRLNLKLVSLGINGESTINNSDSLSVARHCGVDGIIGIRQGVNDIHRRNDCNAVIMWFQNVATQTPGTSIFRRQYLKSEVTSITLRQKLHYFRPATNSNDDQLEGEVVTFGNVVDSIVQPLLSGLHRHSGPSARYQLFTDTYGNLDFERGVWYYLEEEYKAATVATVSPLTYNTDGEYRMWLSPSGQEPGVGSPTIEVLNLDLPTIGGNDSTHISLWGNLQHWTHARGSWYMDDIKISGTFNGPVLKTGTNTATPLPPTVVMVN
jgi:hypothetical protein